MMSSPDFLGAVEKHTEERTRQLIKEKWGGVVEAVNYQEPKFLKNLPVILRRGNNVDNLYIEVKKGDIKEPPLELPLKGGGTIELSQSESGNLVMRVIAHNTKGELESHLPIEFNKPDKSEYTFLTYGELVVANGGYLDDEVRKKRREIDRILALFKKEDIDEERLLKVNSMSKIMQDAILRILGVDY